MTKHINSRGCYFHGFCQVSIFMGLSFKVIKIKFAGTMFHIVLSTTKIAKSNMFTVIALDMYLIVKISCGIDIHKTSCISKTSFSRSVQKIEILFTFFFKGKLNSDIFLTKINKVCDQQSGIAKEISCILSLT